MTTVVAGLPSGLRQQPNRGESQPRMERRMEGHLWSHTKVAGKLHSAAHKIQQSEAPRHGRAESGGCCVNGGAATGGCCASVVDQRKFIF